MKKLRLTLLLFFFTTFLLNLTGCGSSEKIPIPKVEKDVYIYDEDNVIDDKVEKQLNTFLVDLEDQTGAEFAVISIESLLDRDIEDYANNLFNTLGIGKKGEDNGVLLLFSRSDERVRLEVGRGLEGCLNDSKCGKILDDYFVPYREKDEYTKATEQTVKATLNVIAKEYDIKIQGLEKVKTKKSDNDEINWNKILIYAIIFVVILVFLCIVFGNNFDSSGGGYSGGSSFGGDGGFSGGGGFGGGFSGGGGASR